MPRRGVLPHRVPHIRTHKGSKPHIQPHSCSPSPTASPIGVYGEPRPHSQPHSGLWEPQPLSQPHSCSPSPTASPIQIYGSPSPTASPIGIDGSPGPKASPIATYWEPQPHNQPHSDLWGPSAPQPAPYQSMRTLSPTASPIAIYGEPRPHSQPHRDVRGAPAPQPAPHQSMGSPSPISSSCPIVRPIAEPHSPTAAPPRPLPMGQLRYGVSMGRDGAEFPLISIGAVGLRAPVGVYGVLWGFMGRCGALTVSMGPPHNSSPLRTALEDSGAQRRAGQSATGRGGVTERIPQRGGEKRGTARPERRQRP